MKQTFYLIATLIEMSDEVSDFHALFENKEAALETFQKEISECAENFKGQIGEHLIDLPNCKEWRNEDGYGYTVSLEVITPL